MGHFKAEKKGRWLVYEKIYYSCIALAIAGLKRIVIAIAVSYSYF